MPDLRGFHYSKVQKFVAGRSSPDTTNFPTLLYHSSAEDNILLLDLKHSFSNKVCPATGTGVRTVTITANLFAKSRLFCLIG